MEGSSGLGFSRKVTIYKCGIFVKELKQLIYADCGALPFKKAGKNFLVILGMDFIKNFDLEIKAYEKGILLRRPTPGYLRPHPMIFHSPRVSAGGR